MIKLVLPIIISLVLTILYCMKYSGYKLAILVAALINIICLSLGTVWWWMTEVDGLGQLVQFFIYSVCFGVIVIINIITLVTTKRRSH